MKAMHLRYLAIVAAAMVAVACSEKSRDLDVNEEEDAAGDEGGDQGDADSDAPDDGDPAEDVSDSIDDDGDPVVDVPEAVDDVGDPVVEEREAPYECWEGPCCDTDTGHFREPSENCSSRWEYRCTSTNCGAEGEQREYEGFCTGESSECGEEVLMSDWMPFLVCGADQVCETDGVAEARCRDCPGGCTDGVCIEP